MDMLAACRPEVKLGKGETIEIARLAPSPSLQISSEFVISRRFDAACRLARFEPNVLHGSRAQQALLALAEAAHRMAIIPSALRTHRCQMRIVGLTYRGNPMRESMTMLFDKRRPQPPYAAAFCEMLAKYMHEVFPLTRPSEPRAESRARRSTARKAVWRLVHRPGL